MASDSVERQSAKQQQAEAEAEHLPCPRCDSTNTKFCYYNNYNFSQPRHFCKSCRRYWTHGGTLRDIPVGGGSRKNAKRCRTSSSSSIHEHEHDYVYPIFHHDQKPMCGSFTSLLNTQGPALLTLGDFGTLALEDMAFGFEPVWPFSPVGAVASATMMELGGNSWQLQTGDVAGIYFSLPDLAISTPGYSIQ